jgi:hypothetical protein
MWKAARKKGMNQGQPATVDDVKRIVATDLSDCDAEQVAAFDRYRVEPFLAPIVRYGEIGTVVVVARNGNEVMYYEDVEEGFNVSPIAPDGQILEHWCNQDDLRFALNEWIEGRKLYQRLGPAQSIE